MTDQTGIVEHAVFVIPNYLEGYTTDDNARALIVTTLLEELGSRVPGGSADLSSRYLAFLWIAFDPTTKRFRNSLSYERQWQEPEGFGRQSWSSNMGVGNTARQIQERRIAGSCGAPF